ncbi:hypothetical protein B6N25_13755, partial [Sphingobacteriales bacterium TSM_CSS]
MSSGGTYGIQGGESSLNGYDINQSGWGAQVYDCVGADDGAITAVTLTFNCGGTLSSYTLTNPAIINDGACSPGTAAIVTVPATVAPRAGWFTAPSGGTPLNATGSSYTPTDVLPGTYNYYTQCICGTSNCPTTRTLVQLIITPPLQITASNSGPCVGDPLVNLSTNPLTAGTFSGTGVTNTGGGTGTFNPTTAGAGQHTITFTDAGNCISTYIITVYPTYNPAFDLQTNVCVGANVIGLSLTTPLGTPPAGVTATQLADWYGDGVTDNGGNATGSFNPAIAGVGVHTVCVDVGVSTCLATYCQTITVDDCLTDCVVYNTITPDYSETCSSGVVDFSISLGATDNTSVGGQTVYIAAIQSSVSGSSAVDNPYTEAGWTISPVSVPVQSSGGAFPQGLAAWTLTFPANNTCNVIEYQVYTWLTPATITNLGLPATCRPFAGTTILVWPSTSGRNVTVSYSECTAYFTVPSCPTTMYAVTPSGADFVDVGSTTSQAITINTYGAPAACASSALNSPVAVINQLTATAGSCGCSAGSRQVQVTAATGSGNYAYSAEGGTVNGSGLFTFSIGVFSGSVTVTDNTTGCQVNVPISCAPLINPIIIGAKGPFCLDDPISNLTITPNTINDGTFSGPGVTDGAGNTATFDPSTAGVGSHTITYTAATGQTAIGCAYTTTTIIEVTPNYDPTFLLQTNACIDDGNIALTLSTAPASIPSGVTADEIADWYGDGVTDGVGNAGGTFNTLTAGVGVHTICVDVGIPSCLATYCQTIEIYPAANATINDRQVCVTGASGSFTLTSLFSAATTPGGTYTVTPLFGGGTYAISGNELLYTNLASSNPINQVTITYTLETLAGAGGVCSSTDQAVVTFEYSEPYFDAPSSFCTAEPDPDLTLYFNSNTTLGGFFTASTNGPLGTYNNAIISAAGILDMSAAQAAVGVNGLIYIRYTIPSLTGACVDVNHEQVVQISEDCTCPDIQDIQADLVNICDPVDDFTPITAFPVTVTVYLDSIFVGQNIDFYVSPASGFVNPYTQIATGTATAVQGAGITTATFNIPAAVLDLSDTDCDASQFIVYGYLNSAAIANMSLSPTCRPVVATLINVYPDPENAGLDV